MHHYGAKPIFKPMLDSDQTSAVYDYLVPALALGFSQKFRCFSDYTATFICE